MFINTTSSQRTKVRLIAKLGAISILLFNMIFEVHAGEIESKIAEKVAKAYGGDQFKQMKSIRVLDNYKQLYTGQGVDPDFTEVYKNNIDLTVDFENRRKSLTAWESKQRGDRLTQTVFDGSKGRLYDLYHRTYDENEYFNFDTIGSWVTRSHDTLLAHLLWQSRNEVTYSGTGLYRGAVHEKIELKMNRGLLLTLHINQRTGLISKMSRTSGYYGEVVSVFDGHTKTQGITHAKDFQLNVTGKPEIISVKRGIEVNLSLDQHFQPQLGFSPRGETIDASEMTVRALGQGAYFVGQGHRFSLFIDAGEYLVAVGGNAGLAARYEALSEQLGRSKPLKYQVVSHHHSDHLESMVDAEKLGASFITVASHINAIQDSLPKAIPEQRYTLVEQHKVIADGKVEVYDIPSSHSEQNLLVYVPSAKVIFIADHFSTDLKYGLPNVDQGTVYLYQAVEKLGLDAKTFVGAHGARLLTMSDLKNVAKQKVQGGCPKRLTLCRAE